ncbi:hypothetical protein B0H12DRAFT_1165599 [Mycena haematopus]|nr:hypothetical protein B0H12DRAFT_1165599 [Mycena haematopus]
MGLIASSATVGVLYWGFRDSAKTDESEMQCCIKVLVSSLPCGPGPDRLAAAIQPIVAAQRDGVHIGRALVRKVFVSTVDVRADCFSRQMIRRQRECYLKIPCRCSYMSSMLHLT